MSEKTNLELLGSAARSCAQTGETTGRALDSLAAAGRECARSLLEVPNSGRSTHVAERLKELERKLKQGLASRMSPASAGAAGWQMTAGSTIISAWCARRWPSCAAGSGRSAALQHARRAGGEAAPRILLLAEDMLAALEYRFAERRVQRLCARISDGNRLEPARAAQPGALVEAGVAGADRAFSFAPQAEAQPATQAPGRQPAFAACWPSLRRPGRNCWSH